MRISYVGYSSYNGDIYSEDASKCYVKNVNETAQQYIRPTYQLADCIINGMVDKEYIKVITDKIMKKLAEICS